ncbi:hypothetical protein PSCICO_17380 [Pseudomonas cichorii]|jgi:hypothetical protein|uniref:DUF6957 family protein n=1 Tax=Pseudomonas cichorii TaxID=36746 RepID=UPI00190FCEA0|nr:hypothetical protein [Pseudomonas cichorii]GFM86339.1 hypothetical protein PSCICO_17380 [Pseudomonas cichorii]
MRFDWSAAPSMAMNGMNASLDEAIDRVQARYLNRSFCVVRDWVWIEFAAQLTVAGGLASQGLSPHVVVAITILHDSQDRFRLGRGVRTSFLVDYEAPGYFITQNTVYVLMGAGRRIQVPFMSEYLFF